MKKYKNGLVLGKFMPVHNGHLHLINTAIEQCETVYVMVCSIKAEPISGIFRFHSMMRCFPNMPNVKIIHCIDENPQTPEEHPLFWKIWYDSVYNSINSFNLIYVKKGDEVPEKPLDVIFTSEDYGDPFAKVLGIDHVLVDKERTTVPISGTKVREDAFKQWDYIPNVVRGYFTKRIVIMGAESTGKSTIVQKLAEHFKSKFIEEYGRTYTEPMELPYKLTQRDMERIAFGHIIETDKYDMDAERFLFVDTEAITTKIFGELYVDPNFESKSIELMIKAQTYDHYFLLENDVPYVNDGTRLPEECREYSNRRLKEELKKHKIPFISISGTYEERFEKIKNEINNLYF